MPRKINLSDRFKNLFGFGDPLTDLKREYRPIPLKKKGDINYEVQRHTADIENDGHRVLHVAQNRFGESTMIYRLMYGNSMDDQDIHLWV